MTATETETTPQAPTSTGRTPVRAGDIPHEDLVRMLYGRVSASDLPVLEDLAKAAGVGPLDLIAATGHPPRAPREHVPLVLFPAEDPRRPEPGAPHREVAGDIVARRSLARPTRPIRGVRLA